MAAPLLLLALHVLAAAAAAAPSSCNAEDYEALQGLKAGFGQSVPFPDSWSNGTSCCQWTWITCNSYGRVESLNISSLALTTDTQQDESFVGAFIPRLTYLKSLDISNLNISVSVPAALTALRRLETLYMSNCSLSGQFPVELSNLTSLTRLDVSNNLFDTSDAEVTAAVCSLRRLEHLTMSALPGLLTSIPACIGESLTNLTTLDLSSNALTQNFPESFSNLTNLVSLDLSDNYFTGSLRPVCALLRLQYLDLELGFDATNSSGGTSLPDCVGGLTRLTELRLSGCYLVGSIPDTIGRLTNLRYLSLDGNSFTTVIPASLGNLTNLEVLLLNKDATGGSNFYGQLPVTLGSLRRLRDLELSSAPGVTGGIPESYRGLTGLEILTLSNLGLGGELPGDLFSGMGSLEVLDLSQNFFMGEIPGSIRALASLQEVYLYNNSFVGGIPGSIGGLTRLTNLDLSSNQLSGGVPELEALRELQVLDLSGNRLTGGIPAGLGELVDLATLDLSENQLNGSIPSELHDLVSLEYFSVASNQLSGPIPPELSNFDAASFEDNAGLCGYPLDSCASSPPLAAQEP